MTERKIALSIEEAADYTGTVSYTHLALTLLRHMVMKKA